jgi:hypothetical protein
VRARRRNPGGPTLVDYIVGTATRTPPGFYAGQSSFRFLRRPGRRGRPGCIDADPLSWTRARRPEHCARLALHRRGRPGEPARSGRDARRPRRDPPTGGERAARGGVARNGAGSSPRFPRRAGRSAPRSRSRRHRARRRPPKSAKAARTTTPNVFRRNGSGWHEETRPDPQTTPSRATTSAGRGARRERGRGGRAVLARHARRSGMAWSTCSSASLRRALRRDAAARPPRCSSPARAIGTAVALEPRRSWWARSARRVLERRARTRLRLPASGARPLAPGRGLHAAPYGASFGGPRFGAALAIAGTTIVVARPTSRPTTDPRTRGSCTSAPARHRTRGCRARCSRDKRTRGPGRFGSSVSLAGDALLVSLAARLIASLTPTKRLRTGAPVGTRAARIGRSSRRACSRAGSTLARRRLRRDPRAPPDEPGPRPGARSRVSRRRPVRWSPSRRVLAGAPLEGPVRPAPCTSSRAASRWTRRAQTRRDAGDRRRARRTSSTRWTGGARGRSRAQPIVRQNAHRLTFRPARRDPGFRRARAREPRLPRLTLAHGLRIPAEPAHEPQRPRRHAAACAS